VSEPLADFVGRRRPQWTRLEALLTALERKKADLAALSELDRLYRDTAADLARAQLDYGGSDVHRYLNNLSARAYGSIYRAEPARAATVKRFFTHDFPAVVRDELAYFRLSALLLALGAVVGAFSVVFVPGGADLLVDNNLRSIVDNHQLWTDSAASIAPTELAVTIFTNNLSVIFKAFVFGLTFGILTVVVLGWNGIQLGAMLAYCFQHGVGGRLLLFTAAHGWLELSIVALAGAAGLMVGHALLDPKELPRGDALRERGKKAVKIVVGCAPFLVATGIVEGFVSPGTVVPAPLKIALGLAIAGAFWTYLLRAGLPGQR
jgi:uncharacterized membrane protein SpoIIM required for sporulation